MTMHDAKWRNGMKIIRWTATTERKSDASIAHKHFTHMCWFWSSVRACVAVWVYAYMKQLCQIFERLHCHTNWIENHIETEPFVALPSSSSFCLCRVQSVMTLRFDWAYDCMCEIRFSFDPNTVAERVEMDRQPMTSQCEPDNRAMKQSDEASTLLAWSRWRLSTSTTWHRFS